MIKNYLIFNNMGLLQESQLNPVSQGNNNADSFYIGYEGYDYSNGYVTVSFTLPNGEKFVELSTSFNDFNFDGIDYQGFMFKLPQVLTSQHGTLSMTINLNSVEDDTRLCSSRVSVEIHRTNVPIEPTITNEQYNQLLETIRLNHLEVLQKIEELKK